MKGIMVALIALAVVTGASGVVAAQSPRLAFHEEAGRALGDVVDQFRGLGAQLERHLRGDALAPSAAPVERPLITYMLDRRAELGLTPDQVTRLETLRDDFAREAIKREADIRVAEMDLSRLLEAEMLDIAKVDAKMHEVAKLRTDLRVARLRTIEQGKAVLTADQRGKLRTMLGVPGPPRRVSTRGATLF